MILIGVFFFEIGACLAHLFGIKQLTLKSFNEEVFTVVMIRLQIIALIIFIISDLRIISLLRSGYSMADIYLMRINMANGGITELSGISGIVEVMLEYFARPIMAISIPYSCMAIVKNKNKQTFILTCVLLILSYINKANRSDIFMLFVTLIFSIILNGKKIELSKKQKIFILVGGIVAVGTFSYLSRLRGGTNTIGNTVYMYLCGNAPLADIKIQNLGKNFKYTFGLTSLQGFFRLFIQIVEKMGFNPPDLFLIAENYSNVEAAVNIGGNNMYNAFVGLFYYFYCDFGWIGVVIFSMFFGYFSERLFIRYFRTNNIFIATAYLMVLVRGVIFSFYNFLFSGITYAIAFLILVIFSIGAPLVKSR